MLSTVMLAATLVAMGPQWAIVDLPYPDVRGEQVGGSGLDPRISDAVNQYARGKAPAAKPGILPLKVENDTASVRMTLGQNAEILRLERVKGQWRVVQALPELPGY